MYKEKKMININYLEAKKIYEMENIRIFSEKVIKTAKILKGKAKLETKTKALCKLYDYGILNPLKGDIKSLIIVNFGLYDLFDSFDILPLKDVAYLFKNGYQVKEEILKKAISEKPELFV